MITDPAQATTGPTAAPPIETWDQRVRVFVSSTLEELAAERAAVRAAITQLHLTPVMFDLGARAHPPRELYLAYLQHSDVFIGVYGERYGWIAPGSTISGLEEEYLLAGDRPKLLYLRTPAAAREPRLTALIERMWASSGVSTAPYSDADDLGRRVIDDLAVLLTERFRGPSVGPVLDPAPLPHPPSPLIGRTAELDHLRSLLTGPEARLVTLLGPGGIGKTRLALAVAEACQPQLDAVCFVDLSVVCEPGEVLGAVATALRVHPGTRPVAEVLVDVLNSHRVLVVLDNVEHVLAAGPDIARLIALCPETRVLATSRAVLHLRGEHEVELGPLPVPPPADDHPAADLVRDVEAVQLFVHRAEQVRPSFAVTDDNAAEVAGIVNRLEGIPLALELAAARLRLLPLASVVPASALDLASADLDTPARQQTLRATIAWSNSLLAEPDRAALRAVAVLPGGWTLPAAQAVTDTGGSPPATGIGTGTLIDTERGTDATLAQLSRLVEQSMVRVELPATGEPRFRMLEAVRTYALEQLQAAGEYPATMQRLAGYVHRLAVHGAEGLCRNESRRWRQRLDAELDVVRAALTWALHSDDAALAVQISAALARYWWSRGLLPEMLALAESVAGLSSVATLSPAETDLLAWCRGTIRIATGDDDQARDLLTRATEGARARGDDRLLAQALFSSALIAPAATRRSLLEQALALFERRADRWGQALTLLPLGTLELLTGQVDTATRCHTEALSYAEDIEDDHLIALALDQLAADALLTGRPEQAAGHLRRSVPIHLDLHDPEGTANCLDAVAALVLVRGGVDRSARYLAAADRVRQVAGVVVWPFLRPLRDQLVSAVQAARRPGTPSAVVPPVEPVEPAPPGWNGLQALDAARSELGSAPES